MTCNVRRQYGFDTCQVAFGAHNCGIISLSVMSQTRKRGWNSMKLFNISDTRDSGHKHFRKIDLNCVVAVLSFHGLVEIRDFFLQFLNFYYQARNMTIVVNSFDMFELSNMPFA